MPENKMEAVKQFKLFDKYDVSNIQIRDPALKPYIILTPKLVVKSYGRQLEKLSHAKLNIIERIAGRMGVPGHVGKKHKIITNWGSGKYNTNMKTVITCLDTVERKSGKNPIQVLVEAIENCSPRDEITVIESAGARYPQAVDASPLRRVNMAVRWIVQGAYGKSFGKKTKMADALANEILAAARGAMESYAMGKKNESEKQADSAR